MPAEMFKELIGKECTIMLMGGLTEFRATVLAVEENWIRVEEKKKVRIINGDMISFITVSK